MESHAAIETDTEEGSIVKRIMIMMWREGKKNQVIKQIKVSLLL